MSEDTAFLQSIVLDPDPVDNGRRVKLTWTASRYRTGDNLDGIRVRIEATDAAAMSDKVFAYLGLPLRPGESEHRASFDHVCSPVDIEEYPEDEPAPNSRPAWFRLNYVDVLVRSREEARDFVKLVAEDVQKLKTALDVMDDLLPVNSVWIGKAPA